MSEEIIPIYCPTLNKRYTMSQSVETGMLSKQSRTPIFGNVLLKFVDGEPNQIMCPKFKHKGIRSTHRGSCLAAYSEKCIYETWHNLGDTET